MTATLRRRFGRAATAAVGAALAVGLVPGLAAGSASATGSAASAGALSGTITDGSGQDWPLYAKVEAGGKSTFTDPVTGAYTLPLTEPGTYDVTVTAQYPGYRPSKQSVQVAADGTVHDTALGVDAGACSAPGYGLLTEDFTGRTLPEGWSTVDHLGSGHVWEFDDRHERGNLTGGAGGFAILDSWGWGQGNDDSSLVSPSFSAVSLKNPVVTFKTDFKQSSAFAAVEISVDGGTTWAPVWRQWFGNVRGNIKVSLPQATGRDDVRLRWHYSRGTSDWWWQVDDIVVRDAACTPVDGSLLVGQVDDAVTGEGLAGAAVTMTGGVHRQLTSQGSAPDPAHAGHFSAFVPGAGTTTVAATKDEYVTDTVEIDPAPGTVTPVDLALDAGRLELSSTGLDSEVALGKSGTGVLEVTNTGTASAEISVATRGTGAEILAPDGVSTRTPTPDPSAPTTAPAASWAAVPDYPVPVKDNAAGAYGGRIYSFGGASTLGTTPASYRYDPDTRAWEQIAAMPGDRQNMAGAFLDGRFHVIGGWSNNTKVMEPTTMAYDPETDSWRSGPDMPVARAAAGTAVLDGRIYTVGGCDTAGCGHTEVFAYDPAFEEFESLADYPEPTSFLACGGLEHRLICAGGKSDQGGAIRNAYAYDPVLDEWSPIAVLPRRIWGANAQAANGALLVNGGFVNGAYTTTGWRYDPAADVWAPLPASGHARARGGVACGMYRIGGATGTDYPSKVVEVLEGYDDCVDSSPKVPWLNLEQQAATLAPGESVQLKLTMDAAAVGQPGNYLARLGVREDTPYALSPMNVLMNVPAPGSWGALSGTIRGRACDGTVAPLDRVTVTVKTRTSRWTTVTRRQGEYLRWIDRAQNPLQVIVGRDGYTPQVRDTELRRATVEDFTLLQTGC